MRDLYEVLGVERGASPADLKKAYYRLAKQYHPDHNPGDKDAEEKFKEAANAYQVLCDDEQRARYDRFGFDGLRGAGGGGRVRVLTSRTSSPRSAICSATSSAALAAVAPPRGADLRVDLELTFAEAVWGTTKDVKVTRDIACSTCNATGADAGQQARNLQACGGKGQVVHAQGFFMVQTTCPHCRGAGKTIKDPCEDCRGRGTKGETSS